MAKKEAHSSGIWIPLIDYAVKYDVSLSTLRRQIKAKKMVFKKQGRRYLLLDRDRRINVTEGNSPNGSIENEIQELRDLVGKTRKEVAELKMLISLYEEKISQR